MTPTAPTTFTVSVHQLGLVTANQRLHWAVRAARTKTLRQMGAIYGRGLPVMDRAHLTVLVQWPRRHRRDVANLHPTVKAIVDGVVQDAKRLPDDDDKHLIGPDLRVAEGLSGRPGVVRLIFTWEALA